MQVKVKDKNFSTLKSVPNHNYSNKDINNI